MNTHTPGPWHVGVKQANRIVYDSTGWAICDCTVFHGREDSAPLINARLIAASPDLLSALQNAAAWLAQSPDTPAGERLCMTQSELLSDVRAAIARATGAV